MTVRYSKDPLGIYGIHHFEDVHTGEIVDDYHDKLYRQLGAGNYPENYRPISNQEFEVQENDRKRAIKILDSKVVYEFANQFSKMLNTFNVL